MRIISLIAFLLASGVARAVDAQSYPTGPVRLIAPSPPGSPRDIRARWVADRLAPLLGQPVIVENKAGAGGNIGMEAAAKSRPDGQTLVVVDLGTMAQNPHLYSRTGYDPLTDFVPVTRLVDGSLMMAVHPDVPAKSVAELIRLAKANPGSLSYGSSGIGTPPHPWMGIAVPAATPRSIVTRLNTELVRALRQPDAEAWFVEQGGEVIGDDPEEFARVVHADYGRWRAIIHDAGIAAE